MFLIYIKSFLLDLLFPKQCLGCKTEGDFVCNGCLKKIPFLASQCCPNCRKKNDFGIFCSEKCKDNYFFDQLVICTNYKKDELIQKLIIAFKYRYSKEISAVLGEILKTQYSLFFQYISELKDAVIVPVPIHKKKLKERGFNQSLLLANYFCEAMKKGDYFPDSFENLKVVDLLKRDIDCESQAGLNRKERLINLRGAFSLKDGNSGVLKGRLVVLVDDVSTTGTTLNECGKILKEAGAKYVMGFVLARGK